MNTQIKKGGTISYGYDKGGNLNSVSAGGGSEVSHNRIERKLGRVTKVVSDGAKYEYRYDGFGKATEVKVCSIPLYSTYKTAYGDEVEISRHYNGGDSVNNRYDKFGKLISVQHFGVAAPGGTIVENIYDKHDNLVTQKDYSQSDVTLTYNTKLDKYGRVDERNIVENETEVQSVKNTFNDLGQVTTQVSRLQGINQQYVGFEYSQDFNSRLKKIDFDTMNQQHISYDKLGRIASVSNINNGQRKEYYYRQIGDHASNMLASEWLITPQKTERIKYSYDTLGNIVEVNENGKTIVFYTYDALNRLVREDNKKMGKTIAYDYDPSGNITSKAEYAFTRANLDELTPIKEHSYGYTQYANRDQLTNINGQTTWFDMVGNPMMHKNKNLTWSKVRQLKQYGDDISFTYNAAGVRLSKTVTLPATDSIPKLFNTTKYYYDGTTLIGTEKYSHDAATQISTQTANGATYYRYGVDGLYGFVRSDSSDYTYKKNAQGDILAIRDSWGKEIVQYVYDAYGNHKIYALNDEKLIDISKEKEYAIDSTYEQYKELALANPFRYRGYYYDQETGLYYLMSRYYDPETGRFINADDISYLDPETVGGLNLYAYCENNPVSLIDSTGNYPTGFQGLLTLGERFFTGLLELCRYLVKKGPKIIGHMPKIGGEGRRAAQRVGNAAYAQTKSMGKTFGKIAKVAAFATLALDIGTSWYNNYNSGSATWVSDSIVDTAYKGARFAIGWGITAAFSLIPGVGWLIGIGVSIGVDYLIQWAMESGALDAIKTWAARVGQSISEGWNNFWSFNWI